MKIVGSTQQNLNPQTAPSQCAPIGTDQLHVPKRYVRSTFDQKPSVFCDWISLYQVHPFDLPVLNNGLVVSFPTEAFSRFDRVDPDTGELIEVASFDATKAHYTTMKAISFEGSYETSVQIRCDGRRVEFSGNAGRFGRSDNLFGFGVLQCVKLVNEILASLGLPPYTASLRESIPMARSDKYGRYAGHATITRVDLTENYATGSRANAFKLLHSLGGQGSKARGTGSNLPRSYGNGVTWNEGSKRHYSKMYYKADELGSFASPELKAYCEDQGIVRHEVSLKSRELSERGLNTLMAWIQTDEGMDMENIIYGKFNEVIKRNSVSTLELSDIPGKAGEIAERYMTGCNPIGKMAPSTARKWRAALLPYGIDIAVPCNVTRLAARVQVIELRPLTVPDWYSYEPQAA